MFHRASGKMVVTLLGLYFDDLESHDHEAPYNGKIHLSFKKQHCLATVIEVSSTQRKHQMGLTSIY